MTTGTRASFQRAIDKAEALRTYRTVQDLGSGRYAVPGQGALYTVTVDQQGEYACTCRAGQAGQPCYHQGGVWLKRLHQAAMPAAPAAALPGVARVAWTEERPSDDELAAIYGAQRVA